VNRWDSQAQEERYRTRSVFSQLHEFHRHLEKTSPDRSRSIVSHALRVFRQIRTAIDERTTGYRSLKILLHLLASTAARQRRISDDLEMWGLTPDTIDCSRAVPDATWDSLRDQLSGIGRSDDLRPDLRLVLRHSSGAVFQEAHIDAEVSLQRSLPGLEGPAIVRTRTAPSDTGIFFTPPALARTLAEEATRDIPNTANALLLFDPACGSGELLKECMRLLNLQRYAGQLRVIGWDDSPASVDMARFVLGWEKRTWPPGKVEITIERRDSLRDAGLWPTDVDILVMNPPFKSWQLMNPGEQETLAYLLGASNKPNLALAFAHLACRALGNHGTLAMISPNSLFEAASAKSVRAELAEILTPQLIARLGDQSIFSRALVDAGMYVGTCKPANNGAGTAILWTDSRPGSLNRALRGLRTWRSADGAPIKDDGFSVYRRSDVGKAGAPWVARAYEAWTTYESIRSTRRTVAARKVFDIRQGVRLGNDVFIVPKSYVDRLSTKERRFFRPAVMNLSISDARLNDDYFVFYPYTEGLPSIEDEHDLQAHVPTYFGERLSPAKAKLSARKSLAKADLKWWELLWHRSWQRGYDAKIVSKYFGGSRSFAFDRTGEFVVVVGNAWLLKKGAVNIPITDTEIYLAVLAYLSSSIADDLLKYQSIQISGGQWDLSGKYVNGLPIPDLARLKPAHRITELAQIGSRISDGQIDDWVDTDATVRSILGLPQTR
jgi:hypothetical protein